MKTSLAVIDADLVSFIASAASEQRTILATYLKSGRSKSFKNRTEFKEFLKSKEGRWQYDDFSIEDVIKPEPIEYCLHTIKSMIGNIHKGSGCTDFKLVMSGTENFRDNLLLPKEYKGERKKKPKPALLPEAREYILSKFPTEIAQGVESDDVLSWYQYEGFKKKRKIVACTIDKDARQCPGYLYDWNQNKDSEFIGDNVGELFFNNSGALLGSGFKWLCTQWTMGDSSDEYNPTQLSAFQYGKVSAYKDFKDLETEKDCLQQVVNLYKKWYPEPFTYTAWNGQEVNADWITVMQMYVDCAYMQRKKGDRFVVKKQLDKYGVEYDQ